MVKKIKIDTSENTPEVNSNSHHINYIFDKIDILLEKNAIIQQQLSSIERKQDEIKDDQINMRINLQEHIKRTDIAEENISIVREEVRIFHDDIEKRVRPIESDSAQKEGAKRAMKTLLWTLGGIVTISSLINAIPKILQFLHIIP